MVHMAYKITRDNLPPEHKALVHILDSLEIDLVIRDPDGISIVYHNTDERYNLYIPNDSKSETNNE